VAFIDEQILKSSWHGRSEWMNQPLQLIFYREFAAGENFFARMRALLNEGGRESALQVYFLCLALGFRGAYGVSGDSGALETFTSAAQQQLLRRLPSPAKISPNALPRDRARAEKAGVGPLVGILAGCVVVVIGVIASLQWSLRSTMSEALQAMPPTTASSAR
jgi:type VI secretion system protein ImpK